MALPKLKQSWVLESKAPGQGPRLASMADAPIESPARLLQGQIAPALQDMQISPKYPGVVRVALIGGTPVLLWAAILRIFGAF